MNSTLSPSHLTIVGIRTSIQTALKSDIPADLRANHIGPLLSTVNMWSTQIPAMFEGAGPLSSVNLVFSIRKDLFIGPQYAQCVLGIPIIELPSAFQDFVSFIQQLIEAQKADKEKAVPKVKLHTSKSL